MKKNNIEHKLNTFDGVFTPTILTILGVIMYLRLGWVVGNTGFMGALIIIVVSHAITLCTGLSMSSILTNIKIGAGGAYAIISRSLGLEIGGAIGIPLYLSQSFSVAFYIFGFTELWHNFFPSHSVQLVGVIVWFVLTVLSLISAKLAFRVQYLILGAVFLSILSFLGGSSLNAGTPLMWGNYQQASFWQTFAIFFPAATGILAGANMSGELKNPGKNIIKGTLSAIIVGFFVYIIISYWFARQIPENLLLTDTFVILKSAMFKPIIIVGILGAVLSSALSTLVGAPRTLAALANDRIIPGARFLAKKSPDGEPRNAIIVSSLLSFVVILAGNLNTLAGLLTMFFLTTYGAINLVVFFEQVTGIVSFRPRLHLSLIIPAIGFIGCISAMLLINKIFTVVTLVVIIVIYFMLTKKNLVSPWGDVRGGLFTALSEWAAQKAMSRPYHPRLWKPSILVPAETPEDLRRVIYIAQNIIKPSGRFYYLHIERQKSASVCSNNKLKNIINSTIKINKTSTSNFTSNENDLKDITENNLEDILDPIRKDHLFCQIIKVSTIGKGLFAELFIVLETLLHTFLPPNVILFNISHNTDKQEALLQFMTKIQCTNIGLMCLYLHPDYGLGQERKINLWLRDKSPNTNLAVLIALQLVRNWNAHLCLIRAVHSDNEIDVAHKHMESFIEDARLPASTQIKVLKGSFNDLIKQQTSDITILGIGHSYESIFTLIDIVPGTTLFIADSGLENALA